MSGGHRPIDFTALLRACVGRLHMAPDAFWTLSPHECALLLGLGEGRGLARADLAAMMARYPDGKEPDDGKRD